jgi:hypothetical protein
MLNSEANESFASPSADARKIPPPPQAPRLAAVKSVSIRDRKPVPTNQCDVDLLYAVNGKRVDRRATLYRPTKFDEIVAAVVDDDTSSIPTGEIPRLNSPRDAARFAYRMLRDLRARMEQPMRSEKPLFDTRSFEPNNFSHLLIDIIPLCRFANNALGGNVRHVFRKVEGPFRELLDIFEIDVMLTERRVGGSIVRIRGTRGLSAYDMLGTFDVPAITVIPDIYDDVSFKSTRQADKIFIGRRGHRSLLNNADVVQFLARQGYETIYMEDHPVREQLEIAASAKHVVAVHGAGMGALVLNKSLESVVELLPPHVFHQHFPISLSRNVKRYAVVMPEYDEAVPQSGWPALVAYKHSPFSVDLPSLERALAKVGG